MSATLNGACQRLVVTVACLTAAAFQASDGIGGSGSSIIHGSVDEDSSLLQCRVASAPVVAQAASLRSRGRCEQLAQDHCVNRSDCTWLSTGARCHCRLAWFHVMKTGESFGTTLAHYANSSLPRGAHMPSGRNQSDPEDRTTEGSQGEENFFTYKYPVSQWFQQVWWHENNPGNHIPIENSSWEDFSGNFFGIFRNPESRALSAWYHFMNGEGDLVQYAREIRGQQASMLSLGLDGWTKIHCEFRVKKGDECFRTKEPNVMLAVERVKAFAFVGLTEHFDLSVCLFHLMFGGECLPVEFDNMRPGKHPAIRESQRAVLEQHKDPWDGPVYSAAVKIFWGNVRKYEARESTCLNACPEAAHIFSADGFQYEEQL